jgi:hypothetical protein
MALNVASQSKAAWKGFRPKGYQLDAAKVLGLPLTLRRPPSQHERTGLWQEESVATTVGDLLADLKNQRIKKVTSDMHLTIVCDHARFVVDGPGFNRELLRTLVRLKRKNVGHLASTWYWFASEYGDGDDTNRYHRFFVVDGRRIAISHVQLAEWHGNGFDPGVFAAHGEHYDEFAEAWTRYWYRRFYEKTLVGQLTVLRPDGPALYFGTDEAARDRKTPSTMRVVLSYVWLVFWTLLKNLIVFAVVAAMFGAATTRFETIAVSALVMIYLQNAATWAGLGLLIGNLGRQVNATWIHLLKTLKSHETGELAQAYEESNPTHTKTTVGYSLNGICGGLLWLFAAWRLLNAL